jgi:nucleotide-binding universal stress UspA family protein
MDYMGVHRVVVWLTETTWKATIDATADLFGEGVSAEVVLLYVTDSVIDQAAHGAFDGLLGRGPRGRDPGEAIARIAAQASQQLLDAAYHRLGRPATLQARTGHVEREVVAAAEGADLLVCARDADQRQLGPHSLGRTTRSVVDHAPCAVLLIWPDAVPDLGPPPPEHPAKPPPPPHP